MKFRQPKSLEQIAQLVEGALVPEDAEGLLEGVSSLESCQANDLVFVESPEALACFYQSSASAALVPHHLDLDQDQKPVIVVDNPKVSVSLLLEEFLPVRTGVHQPYSVDPTAQVDARAFLGTGVVVGPRTRVMAGAVLDDGVSVGADCVVSYNVTLLWNTIVGDRVVIHPNTVLGADGFSYAQVPTGHGQQFENTKIHQVGNVVVENDVEIGANVCIDRAMLDSTVIGEGTKIDNLVQIGHNCKIGKHCVIVSQTGLSGSVQLGDNCILAARSGVSDHLRIAAGTVLLGTTVVKDDIEKPGYYLGVPAQERSQFWRQHLALNQVPVILKALKSLARCNSFEEFQSAVHKLLSSSSKSKR